MPEFVCSAILFDLDGVLVDSTRSVSRQWCLWAQERSLDPEKLLEIAHGRRTAEVVQLLLPQLDAEAEAGRIEEREAADTDGVRVMPGAHELIASIPSGRWGVVTSGTRRLATSRLKLAGIPIPQVLVSADDVNEGKPHAEPYLKGARLLGVNPAECLVIEDAPAGLAAAHAGNMMVIALTSTYPAQQLCEADAVVSSLREITLSVDGSARKQLVRISVPEL
jgi:sugar-phosphatase